MKQIVIMFNKNEIYFSLEIMEDIIHQNKITSSSKWKILVLDRLSVRIMSACCKMKDVIDKGITCKF